MKAGAFILLLLFVIMSVQPSFINWSKAPCIKAEAAQKTSLTTTGCKTVCSSGKKTYAKPPLKQQGEKSSKTCNPFMVCNGCPYIPGEQQSVYCPEQDKIENTNLLRDETLPSYNTDFWHPPELFMRL